MNSGNVAQAVAWRITGSDQLSANCETWDRFVEQEGYPPFLRASFIGHAMEAFGFARGYLAMGYCSGRLVAIAVLERLFGGRWQVFQPSQLPLGACAIGRNWRWEELLPSLLQQLPGLPMSIGITQQDPKLVERPEVNGQIEIVDYVPTAWVELVGSFDDFWLSRGKNLRQNLRKQRRKLEEQGFRLKFEFLVGPEDIASAFKDFAKLESAGWKADAGSAITANNDQGRFYDGMLQAFALNKSAFAMRLSLDDRPIAVDFGVMDSTTLVILKTTYDEKLKGSSPAQLLHEQAFEYFFGLPSRPRVEFYGKVMEWHTRWSDQSRLLFHLNYYRASVIGRVRSLLKRIGPARI